ncbi:MAG: SDR family NAD(P)-dependent oxidoreductase [Coriobacteriales bacterium]
MGRMENKIAVVTGATSGIGAATAKMFAKEGAKVVATGRNEERGNAVVNEILSNGGDAIFVQGDLRVKDTIAKLSDAVHRKYGKPNVLFNSSGILRSKPFLEQTDQDLVDIVETNFRSYMWTMQAFIPDMVELGGGSIVNVASISSIWPELNSYYYGAMKAAVTNVSRNVAKEFAPKRVRVNCILPGPVLTNMTPKAVQENPDLIANNFMLGRIVYPEDIAYGAVYLASDESAMVTGSNLVIDAGTCVSNEAGGDYDEMGENAKK